MIRVLQVLGKLNRGGAETMIMNIYRNIDRTKIQFDFVKHTTEKCAYEDEILSLGGRIYNIPQYKLYNHLKYKKEWKKLLFEHDEWKIVHSHIRSTATILLKIAKKENRITISHSHSISNGKGLKAIIKKKLQSSLPQYSDYMFACSKEAGEWLFGKNKFKIIPNSIEAEKFKYNENVRNNIRKCLNIEKDYVLGMVGRLTEVKNHRFMINIFSKMIKQKSNLKLLIIGSGPNKKKLYDLVEKLNLVNDVIFLEEVENIQNYYQAFDIFVFPSLWEGLGMVAIEAQCSGLKCFVSSEVPSIIDIGANLVEFININDENLWINRILEKKELNRLSQVDKVKAAGFDISENAKNIEKFYLNIKNK